MSQDPPSPLHAPMGAGMACPSPQVFLAPPIGLPEPSHKGGGDRRWKREPPLPPPAAPPSPGGRSTFVWFTARAMWASSSPGCSPGWPQPERGRSSQVRAPLLLRGAPAGYHFPCPDSTGSADPSPRTAVTHVSQTSARLRRTWNDHENSNF